VISSQSSDRLEHRACLNLGKHQILVTPFLGVNEQTYPQDLASFVRHYTELKKLTDRYPMPEPLSLDQFDQFLAQFGGRSPIQALG
jgi:hypothetical protein